MRLTNLKMRTFKHLPILIALLLAGDAWPHPGWAAVSDTSAIKNQQVEKTSADVQEKWKPNEKGYLEKGIITGLKRDNGHGFIDLQNEDGQIQRLRCDLSDCESHLNQSVRVFFVPVKQPLDADEITGQVRWIEPWPAPPVKQLYLLRLSDAPNPLPSPGDYTDLTVIDHGITSTIVQHVFIAGVGHPLTRGSGPTDRQKIPEGVDVTIAISSSDIKSLDQAQTGKAVIHLSNIHTEPHPVGAAETHSIPDKSVDVSNLKWKLIATNCKASPRTEDGVILIPHHSHVAIHLAVFNEAATPSVLRRKQVNLLDDQSQRYLPWSPTEKNDAVLGTLQPGTTTDLLLEFRTPPTMKSPELILFGSDGQIKKHITLPALECEECKADRF